MQEFALTAEGVALMCLAEALLRIPDDARRAHPRQDRRRQLAAAPRLEPVALRQRRRLGPLLTGKLVATHSDSGLTATLRRVVARGGEPLIRKGVDIPCG
ncbi:MAG: hypothetical protein U1F25_05420 [Rubrivivax sp.]